MYKLNGSPGKILIDLKAVHPEIIEVLERVRINVPFIKRQVAEYQGALLYAIAKKYNFLGAVLLEIGTAWGYSAACLAEGAPYSEIATLNPKMKEVVKAKEHLRPYKNIEIYVQPSMQYYEYAVKASIIFDLIFIDGNHDRIEDDLKWWSQLRPDGIMIFHDYAPDDSGRPCRQVYDVLNEWKTKIGREFDLRVIDNQLIGMVGMIKKGKE